MRRYSFISAKQSKGDFSSVFEPFGHFDLRRICLGKNFSIAVELFIFFSFFSFLKRRHKVRFESVHLEVHTQFSVRGIFDWSLSLQNLIRLLCKMSRFLQKAQLLLILHITCEKKYDDAWVYNRTAQCKMVRMVGCEIRKF